MAGWIGYLGTMVREMMEALTPSIPLPQRGDLTPSVPLPRGGRGKTPSFSSPQEKDQIKDLPSPFRGRGRGRGLLLALLALLPSAAFVQDLQIAGKIA